MIYLVRELAFDCLRRKHARSGFFLKLLLSSYLSSAPFCSPMPLFPFLFTLLPHICHFFLIFFHGSALTVFPARIVHYWFYMALGIRGSVSEAETLAAGIISDIGNIIFISAYIVFIFAWYPLPSSFRTFFPSSFPFLSPFSLSLSVLPFTLDSSFND